MLCNGMYTGDVTGRSLTDGSKFINRNKTSYGESGPWDFHIKTITETKKEKDTQLYYTSKNTDHQI